MRRQYANCNKYQCSEAAALHVQYDNRLPIFDEGSPKANNISRKHAAYRLKSFQTTKFPSCTAIWKVVHDSHIKAKQNMLWCPCMLAPQPTQNASLLTLPSSCGNSQTSFPSRSPPLSIVDPSPLWQCIASESAAACTEQTARRIFLQCVQKLWHFAIDEWHFWLG